MQINLQLRKIFLQPRPQRQEQPGSKEAIDADGEAPGWPLCAPPVAEARRSRASPADRDRASPAGVSSRPLVPRTNETLPGALPELANLPADGAGGDTQFDRRVGHRSLPRCGFESANGIERR